MVIIDGAVAGVLSSVMIRMGGKDAQVNEKIKAAKMWMREQRIPKDQASKALEYFRLVYKSRVMYEEADILNTCVAFGRPFSSGFSSHWFLPCLLPWCIRNRMPPAMKLVFSTQLYEKFLREIPLFRGLPTSLIHSLCSIVVPIQAVRGQVIYAEGTTGKEFYLLLSGELEITANGERLGFLSDGAFFGETPILDDASHAEIRRRTVTAMVDCKLCYLHKDEMKSMCERYPELALRLKRCARTEVKVNKKSRKFMAAMAEAAAGPISSGSSFTSKTQKLMQAWLPTGSPASPTAADTGQLQRQLEEQAAMLKSVLRAQQDLVAAVERLEKRDAAARLNTSTALDSAGASRSP
jgi:CRP-like cAMP-binding protein